MSIPVIYNSTVNRPDGVGEFDGYNYGEKLDLSRYTQEEINEYLEIVSNNARKRANDYLKSINKKKTTIE